MLLSAVSKRTAFLSTAPADRRTRRIALAMALLSFAVFAAAAPFARVQLPALPAFIPLYQSALAIGDLITAVLLFAQFQVVRARAVLVLACGYLFTALMAVIHALTFPGLFAPTGLLGAGPQTTAWLYMFWHGVFPMTVIAYALLKDTAPVENSARRLTMLSLVAVAGAALALTLLATAGQKSLPPIMVGNSYTPQMILVVALVWLLSVAGVIMLWLRPPYRLLDFWLMVVMCVWLCDVALSAVFNAGRYDLGFYAGRVYGLLAATIVLVMLLLELSALYARLFRVAQSEHEQREHAMGALRNSLARQHALFSSAFVGIITVDQDGLVESFNPAAERLFGCRADAAVRRDVGQLIDLRDVAGADSPGRIRQLVESSDNVREFEATTAGGARVPVDIMVAEMPIEDQRMFVIFARDISEKKRVERMKDEFVATVSHELRTPVTSMVAAIGLLANDAAQQIPDPVRRLIGMAHNNGRRLARLLNDILDIDQIESSKMTFHIQPAELNGVVQKAVAENRALADAARIGLRVEPFESVVVRTDPDRLTQVLSHLLSNAVKFSPPGAEAVISVAASEDSVRISVRDQGPGIPEDFRERIFEKFAQVDATDARLKGGTGLGLSIVRQIVLRLGGEVNHRPAPCGGTYFYIDLPQTRGNGPGAAGFEESRVS